MAGYQQLRFVERRDYYRNLNRDDFERRLDLPALFASHAFFRNDVSDDLYFVGRTHGVSRPLRLDLQGLRSELAEVNTLVRPDARPLVLDRLRYLKDLPLKWARRLPDPAYQAFAIRWAGAEKAVRRALRGK